MYYFRVQGDTAARYVTPCCIRTFLPVYYFSNVYIGNYDSGCKRATRNVFRPLLWQQCYDSFHFVDSSA